MEYGISAYIPYELLAASQEVLRRGWEWFYMCVKRSKNVPERIQRRKMLLGTLNSALHRTVLSGRHEFSDVFHL